MKKKYVMGGLALIAAVSLLAACGGSKDKVGKDGKEKIVVWGGVPEENGVGEVLDGFRQANPEIDVEYYRYVNDETGNTKLDTALVSGEQIDVFFSYGDDMIKKRVDSGITLEMSEVGGDTFADKNIGKESLMTFDGKLYGLPTAVDRGAIAVNEAMFKKAGIPIPTVWTWSEFQEIAKKLTTTVDGKTIYGVGALPNNLEAQVLGADAFYKKGGKESNFDDPAFEGRKLYHTMMYEDKTAYPYSQVVARDIKNNEYQLLLSEDVAMSYYSTWMSRALNDVEQYPRDFKLAFAPLPTPDGNQEAHSLNLAGNTIMINSQTNDKELAWKFVEYWLTDGASAMLKAGKVPATDSVEASQIVEGVLGPDAEKLYDVPTFEEVLINQTGGALTPKNLNKKVELLTILKEEDDKYYLNEIDFETYITNLKTRADAELKK